MPGYRRGTKAIGRPESRTADATNEVEGSAGLGGGPWTVPALGHELLELGAVLRLPQAIEVFAEFALLLFQPPQGFRAVIVEGAVAAGARAPRIAAHPAPHPVHLFLQALHFVLPTVARAVMSASHASAPNDEGQQCQAEGPPDHEAEDHQGDPGRLSQLVELCGDRHLSLACEC